jgi:hypothetical protein
MKKIHTGTEKETQIHTLEDVIQHLIIASGLLYSMAMAAANMDYKGTCVIQRSSAAPGLNSIGNCFQGPDLSAKEQTRNPVVMPNLDR